MIIFATDFLENSKAALTVVLFLKSTFATTTLFCFSQHESIAFAFVTFFYKKKKKKKKSGYASPHAIVIQRPPDYICNAILIILFFFN